MLVDAYLANCGFVRVLEDWRPSFSGYHLYYPSPRQPSAAFALLVNALRYPPDRRAARNDRMKGGSRLDVFHGIELYARRLGFDNGMLAHQPRTPASGAARSFILQIEGRKPPLQSIDCLQ